MNKVISWAFAVALICGLNVFTSCKSDDSQVSPVESQERLELEAALSRSLNEASKDTRFDVGKDVLKNLTEIVANMNDEALKELRNEIITTVLNNADLVFFEKTGGSGWYRIVEAIHSLKSVNPRMDFIILHRSSNTYNEVYWAVRSRVSAFLPKPVEYRQLETEFQNLFYHHK